MLNDREKLIELVKRAIIELDYGDAAAQIADHLIANGVTVRKKGEWKGTGNRHYDGLELMRCSVCGCVIKGDYMKFCPSCGADMRGE